MQRIHDIYRPTEERSHDWCEVECTLTDEELKEQTSRCMNCGQPFCHAYGCPLGNLVPDQNRAVAQGDWGRAYALLSVNSDFPEFTSRICPALCEASCVHGLDEEAVMVRQSEKRIIETAFANGWVVPRPPIAENGKSVAVIGAGPAGLSAAVTLRRRGFAVTVYERRKNIGGLLRYGIPCFKLDKALIDRRRKVMEAEGIRFVTDCEVGKDVSAEWLKKEHDAVVVAIGTPAARDLKIPGRELKGVHLALELLEGQNRFLTGEIAEPPINAKGKKVLVIGGGDTGSDCVGTSIRQGAASVTQIEIMPKPPDERDASTPWPLWPYMLRTSSSHKEGCVRRWNLNSLKFVGRQTREVPFGAWHEGTHQGGSRVPGYGLHRRSCGHAARCAARPLPDAANRAHTGCREEHILRRRLRQRRITCRPRACKRKEHTTSVKEQDNEPARQIRRTRTL